MDASPFAEAIQAAPVLERFTIPDFKLYAGITTLCCKYNTTVGSCSCFSKTMPFCVRYFLQARMMGPSYGFSNYCDAPSPVKDRYVIIVSAIVDVTNIRQ